MIIPDVHGRTFWRNAVKGHENDKIIFLGDYIDPYDREGIRSGEAYLELLDIIAFKKAHPDNVVLLLGNHDLGYLDPAICTCRQDFNRAVLLNRLFNDNLALFDIIHIEEMEGRDLLFSHAGIAERWIHNWRHIVGKIKHFRPEHLNELLHGDMEERSLLFKALADVSWYRGGTKKTGSPVWADVLEFIAGERFLGGYLHIFGHTMLEDGPINIRDHGICLDCSRAFILNPA